MKETCFTKEGRLLEEPQLGWGLQKTLMGRVLHQKRWKGFFRGWNLKRNCRAFSNRKFFVKCVLVNIISTVTEGLIVDIRFSDLSLRESLFPKFENVAGKMISVIQSTNILSTFRPIKESNTLFCISSFIALNIKLGNISTKNKTIKRS